MAQAALEKPGVRLKILRGMALMTGVELSELSGITANHIYQIEQGFRRLTRDASIRFASVFGCRPEWIVSGEGGDPTIAQVVSAADQARRDRVLSRN